MLITKYKISYKTAKKLYVCIKKYSARENRFDSFYPTSDDWKSYGKSQAEKILLVLEKKKKEREPF